MFKKIIPVIALLLVFQSTFAQTVPVKKIYAYKQASLSGKKPSGKNEVEKKERYRLFIAHNAKDAIKINGIWVMEEYYRFEVSSKLKSPVKQNEAEGSEQIILVPKTSHHVLELLLQEKQEPSPRPGSQLGKLLKMNEVVISYTWKGKQYFAIAKTIKELPPFIRL